MMYCEGSSISCGVDTIYGFEHEEPGESVENLLRVVSRSMWGEAYEEDRWREDKKPHSLSAAVFLFSDIKGDNGDRFGMWLLEMFPDDVQCIEAKNPNSGNQIVTYMWRPNAKALSKIPAWTEGKKVAAKESKDRRAAGW